MNLSYIHFLPDVSQLLGQKLTVDYAKAYEHIINDMQSASENIHLFEKSQILRDLSDEWNLNDRVVVPKAFGLNPGKTMELAIRPNSELDQDYGGNITFDVSDAGVSIDNGILNISNPINPLSRK